MRMLWIAALTTLVGPAARMRADQPLAPIFYTIKFPAAGVHYADIEATVPTGKRTSIELMMAIWSPGFYRVENYSDHVVSLTVHTSEGKALSVDHARKNRWRVQTLGAPAVTVSYRLLCTGRSVTTDWVGDDGAVLNGPATFITLVEPAHRPHEVRLELPPKWTRSMTGLDPAADGLPNHYRALDFDMLADCPIVAGNLAVFEFEIDGSKHYLVNAGDYTRWDGYGAAGEVEKIVREHRRMWGFLPFKRYVFLIVFRQGGGGLEHKNSTLITTNPMAIRSGDRHVSWLGLVSHEYFHAFNVKRLRPIELGPFDYEHEVHTTCLWVSEGFTTYYGELIVPRAGLSSRQDFLSRLSSHIEQLQNSPGRLVETLEQASDRVWTESFSGVTTKSTTVSYYVKGPVVAWLLDAKIRRATSGSKTLDHVMRLAYERYSGERGFTPDQFRKTVEEVAGCDLKEWFRKAVASTEELDYTEALDWLGLRFATGDGRTSRKTWKLETRSDASEAQKSHLREWLSPGSTK
jgi:predicted metalloprotease with PDZ domain